MRLTCENTCGYLLLLLLCVFLCCHIITSQDIFGMAFTYPAAMWSGALPAHVMTAMVEWASNQVGDSDATISFVSICRFFVCLHVPLSA